MLYRKYKIAPANYQIISYGVLDAMQNGCTIIEIKYKKNN